MNAFPLVSFDLVDNALADALLETWGHWLGGCNRPFGRQSFGLELAGTGVVSLQAAVAFAVLAERLGLTG